MSPAEAILWRELQLRSGGFKFRRQFPLHPYALDFACLATRLAIEVDGETHARGSNPLLDQRRDGYVASKGFDTLRIPAVEMFRNLDGVLAGIVDRCQARGPLHHRPAAGGPPPRSGEDKE